MHDPICLSDEERACDSPPGQTVSGGTKYPVALYVDRTTQQWVVRDPQGHFWQLPEVDDSWEHRQPFELTEDIALEAVPGHYQYMLNLPF